MRTLRKLCNLLSNTIHVSTQSVYTRFVAIANIAIYGVNRAKALKTYFTFYLLSTALHARQHCTSYAASIQNIEKLKPVA